MLKIKRGHLLLLLLYAFLNTLFSLGILYILNFAITRYSVASLKPLSIPFFSFIVFSYLLNLFFQKRIVEYAYNFVYNNELILAKNFLKLSLIQLEKLGTERIHGIIEDMRVVIFLPGLITNTVNSLLMIVLCIGYMFTLSAGAAVMVVLLIAAIASLYVFIGRSLSRKLNRLRNYNDRFNKFIQDILHGFKELRISETRRNNLYENHLHDNRTGARDLDKGLANSFNVANVLNQYGLYMIIGIILFVLPKIGFLEEKQMVSFVVVLLFMSGPINRLITMQNLYVRMHVALKRIRSFFKEIYVHERPEAPVKRSEFSFNTLEFENYQFSHESFTLGPVNLSVTKGETLFIIGGNGSGKSTFINLLTGLYQPSQGTMLLNGTAIENNDPGYQQLLSVIFTDNYLFSTNYDQYTLKGNKKYQSLLELMEMDKIITDDEDKSTRRKFSKGQSKRMSMIFALLEDHPVLVLDEWAADQDPYFRKFFYEELLPGFKQQGKTIIAVTHDDAYFRYADRILKFEYGKIVSDVKVKETALNSDFVWKAQ